MANADVPDPWQSRAACAAHDPELWFAPRDDHAAHSLAVSVCGGCPVREDCLDAALVQHEEYGIWGGKTYMERVRNPRSSRVSLTVNCGTLAGFRKHLAGGEDVCGPCADADERRKRRMVCGSRNGYMAHKRSGEEACRACLDASAEYGRMERERGRRNRELSLSRGLLRDNSINPKHSCTQEKIR